MRADRTYLGRYAQGDKVPLFVTVRSSSGTPAIPDSIPWVRLYRGSELVRVALLPLPVDPSAPVGFFAAGLHLGSDLVPGEYLAVYAWVIGGSPGISSARFTVDEGGDPWGGVISIYHLSRPPTSYVVAQLSSGVIVAGRGPSTS